MKTAWTGNSNDLRNSLRILQVVDSAPWTVMEENAVAGVGYQGLTVINDCLLSGYQAVGHRLALQ